LGDARRFLKILTVRNDIRNNQEKNFHRENIKRPRFCGRFYNKEQLQMLSAGAQTGKFNYPASG
jgi:hypothetical protein